MNDTKVLLINPPRGLARNKPLRPKFRTQPLGLAYVASTLEKEHYHVEILDAYNLGSNAEEIKQVVRETTPDVIGITAVTPLAPDAYTVTEIVKAVDNRILTVMGGVHATALPEKVLQAGSADVVVIGEGEHTMLELCNKIEGGSRDFSDVPGIRFVYDGEQIETPRRPVIGDLDAISFPAHHLLLPMKSYNPYPHWGRKGHFSAVITSRGCPYSCFFCSVTKAQGRKYRYRSPRNVVDELEWLNKEYGVSTFSFRDGTVTLNRRRIVKICEMIIEKGLDITWNCTATVNEVGRELLQLMKKAHCAAIQYGIEVGNPEMLKRIKKQTQEKVRRAITLTDEVGIEAHGYFMFGLPGETAETIEDTINFAKSLRLTSAGFGTATPFPGTDFWDYALANELLMTTDWNEFDVRSIPVVKMGGQLSPEQILRTQKRAYREFYTRPKMVYRYLKKMTSFSSLANYAWKMKETFF